MASRRQLVVQAEEDLDAPQHRRWRAIVRLPDGSEHETFAHTWELLLEHAANEYWVTAECVHPDCDEPCTEADFCPACRVHVCGNHNLELDSHHVLEDHWAGEDGDG